MFMKFDSTKRVKKYIRYWGEQKRRGLTDKFFLELLNTLIIDGMTLSTIMNDKGIPGGKPRERRAM